MSSNVKDELFRKEILDNLSSRYIGKVVISTPITFKVLVLIFAIIGVMILTFIFMGSYTKK
ncbi:TPA: HlyD family secretion protein, partial [Acinetobacter baumannii]